MSFSSSMVEVKYLLPCTHATADALGCDPQDEDKCKTCPSERAYAGVDCCVESGRESSNMNGPRASAAPARSSPPVWV